MERVLKVDKLNRIFEKSELGFKFSFLILCLFNFNSLTFGHKISSVFVVTTLILAGVSLLGRILNYKYYVSKTFFLLVLFLISYVITLFLTISYGFLTPAKTLVWLALQMFLLFLTDDRKSIAAHRRELKWLFSFYTIFMFLSSVSSIVFVFPQYSDIRYVDNIPVICGFIWGRLWGIYTDPNYAAVMAIISILISLYFLATISKRLFKTYHILNIVAQMVYVCFSDSRTGLVALFVSLFVYTLLQVLKRGNRICKLGKVSLSVVMSLLVGTISIFAISTLKTGYNVYVSSLAQQDSTGDTADPDTDTDIAGGNVTAPPINIVGREDDIKNDISNRRFDLWKSGLETVMTRPLFGISFNNLVPYVQEHLPETYLVNNDHGVFGNYHNAWIDILVGQGFVGFAIFVLLGVALGIKSVKRLAQQHNADEDQLYIAAFAIVVATLVSSLFLHELVYTLSPSTYMFWLLLGVLVSKSPGKEGERV